MGKEQPFYGEVHGFLGGKRPTIYPLQVSLHFSMVLSFCLWGCLQCFKCIKLSVLPLLDLSSPMWFCNFTVSPKLHSSEACGMCGLHGLLSRACLCNQVIAPGQIPSIQGHRELAGRNEHKIRIFPRLGFSEKPSRYSMTKVTLLLPSLRLLDVHSPIATQPCPC